jgi:hypothetical protein
MDGFMKNAEFLRYEPTPGERHLGIATIRLYSKIVLRYKIVPTKDGAGFFPAPASYKIPAINGEEERYISAFTLDSQCEKEELDSFIKAHVKSHLGKPLAQSQNAHGGPFNGVSGHMSPNDPFNQPHQAPHNAFSSFQSPSYSRYPEPAAQQALPGFDQEPPF